jgi:hypothetical protein
MSIHWTRCIVNVLSKRKNWKSNKSSSNFKVASFPAVNQCYQGHPHQFPAQTLSLQSMRTPWSRLRLTRTWKSRESCWSKTSQGQLKRLIATLSWKNRKSSSRTKWRSSRNDNGGRFTSVRTRSG